MNNLKDILDSYIYPNIDKARIIKNLDPIEKNTHYIITCPNCGKKEAYLSKNSNYIECSPKNNCLFSISLWDYFQKENRFSNEETFEELARLANFTLPLIDSESIQHFEKVKNKEDLLQNVLIFFQKRLWDERGKYGLEYLKKGRKYGEEEIMDMGLGFCPGFNETKE